MFSSAVRQTEHERNFGDFNGDDDEDDEEENSIDAEDDNSDYAIYSCPGNIKEATQRLKENLTALLQVHFYSGYCCYNCTFVYLDILFMIVDFQIVLR